MSKIYCQYELSRSISQIKICEPSHKKSTLFLKMKQKIKRKKDNISRKLYS